MGDVAHVASVSEACCKHLFKIFHLFLNVCCNRSDLDVSYASHICCKCFSWFSIMLQQLFHVVSSVLFERCCICFSRALVSDGAHAQEKDPTPPIFRTPHRVGPHAYARFLLRLLDDTLAAEPLPPGRHPAAAAGGSSHCNMCNTRSTFATRR